MANYFLGAPWLHNVHGLAAASLAALLAACGGGSGSTTKPTDTNNGPPPGSSAPITADNALNVVRSASEALMAAHMLSGMSTGMISSSASGNATPPRIMSTAVAPDIWQQLADAQADPLTQLAAMQTTPRALVDIPSIPCADGGAILRQWDDVNADTKVDTGDNFTFTFNNCIRNGATRSGSIAVTRFNLTGDPTNNPGIPWTFTATATLNNLSTVRSDGTTTASGTLALTWRSGTTMMEQATMSADELKVTTPTQSFNFSSTSMNMAMDMSTTPMSTGMQMDTSVTVSDIGALHIQTVQPMLVKQGDIHPSAGAMRVSLGSSRVDVVTQSTTSVVLQIDGNSDGSVDATVNSSWDAIHNMHGNMPGGTGSQAGGSTARAN
jgi:hypothetical protein